MFLFSKRPWCPSVAIAQEWIEQHKSEPIDYELLAQKLRMSRRSMERRFKQSVGVTPLGYLQKLRVESAKRLLEEGTLQRAVEYRGGWRWKSAAPIE